MAKYYGHDPIELNKIYDLALQWKNDCLINDGWLLWPGESIWTLDNLQDFKRCFVDNPDETADSFEEKFKKQLAGESSDVTKLACELLFIYFLFPSDTNGKTKVNLIKKVASWKGLNVPLTSNLNVLLESKGIGKPGTAFHTRRPFELSYLCYIGLGIKRLNHSERNNLIDNHKDFRVFIDELRQRSNYAMRNIILHLLYPEYYERISSNGNKQQIYNEFKRIMKGSNFPDNIDDAIYKIRRYFEQKNPSSTFDFYNEPLVSMWKNEDPEKIVMEASEDYSIIDNDNFNERRQNKMTNDLNKNMVLFGPPGTGKTYSVIERALEIIDKEKYSNLINNPDKREAAVKEFKELLNIGQIAFCTFHQSYGYEEFVEGLRSDGNGGFEPRDGIFKMISNAARSSAKDNVKGYDFDEKKINFFKMSLGNTNDGEEDIFDYCLDHNVIGLGWGVDIDYSDCVDRKAIRKKYESKYGDQDSFNIVAVDRFKNRMTIGDIVFISHGNAKLKAIARVTGDYYYDENTTIEFNHFHKVEWLYVNKEPMVSVKQILINKNFSQQAIYMHSKDDINFNSLKSYLSPKGGMNRNYVLIIDEINRGNISKIFGELITLIEPDKRLDADNEVTVTLPYSNDSFGVPQNLYIIGTMNTADRSIALLDTALRRRFNFIELSPDYSILDTDVEGINVQKLLKAINDRIEYLYDQDHLIGHAYFIDKHLSVPKLVAIMKTKVIPLLQEYFYLDWEKLELLLGGATDNLQQQQEYFLFKKKLDPSQIFARNLEYDQSTKISYTIVAEPNEKALKRIYGDN
ncbi:ATPase family protein [Desulfitobacterium hafniense DP7]|uniref:ATPase family protein n=1 Tax=Desulfitobacterium hafniense DP7 TaxID=537010 RepID=G9XSA5_DESHA|nr:AAA family ATPase [Desulfitobacterium hafniense]EHL05504.1 ATPase family protein [Desulfitobacterium hafniense DP7]